VPTSLSATGGLLRTTKIPTELRSASVVAALRGTQASSKGRHTRELAQFYIMTTRLIPASPPGGRVLHPSISMPDFSTTPKSESSRRVLSPPTSPGSPSSVDLQQHIYNSLLESRTADISLHVRGTWEAVYKLHRVVLIQSVSTSIIQRLSS